MASLEVQKTVMSCNQRFFSRAPAQIHQSVSFFCKEFGGGQRVAKAALKGHVDGLSEETMKTHAADLKAAFGWSDLDLTKKLNQCPQILKSQTSTIDQHVKELQMLGFTHHQAQRICATHPRLAQLNWTSQVTHDKLQFVLHVLQMTPAEISARPVILTYSLAKQIGPRLKLLC